MFLFFSALGKVMGEVHASFMGLEKMLKEIHG